MGNHAPPASLILVLQKVLNCRNCLVAYSLFLGFDALGVRTEAGTRGVLGNFTKFPGNVLHQSLFFNKVAGPGRNTFFIEHFWATASVNLITCMIRDDYFCLRICFVSVFCSFFTQLKFCGELYDITWLTAFKFDLVSELSKQLFKYLYNSIF